MAEQGGRLWSDEQFDAITDFLLEHERSPSQRRVIHALQGIALEELDMIDTNEVIETCADALCALAHPYAEAPGWDPNWKSDLA